MTGQLLVNMRDIEKAFSGVRVLHNGAIKIRAGEVHALMGANGAGKSTLMKILVGVYARDSGTLEIATRDNQTETPDSLTPKEASAYGIAIVHQELILLDELTISENIALGSESLNRVGLIKDRDSRKRAKSALAAVGLQALSPRSLVGSLSTAKKQLVEIARALSSGARVIILDEPTTALSASEADNLMGILRQLREQGVGIVYISHRLDEIFALTDRITVMRDGSFVDEVATSDVDRDSLVRMMIGRELQKYTARLQTSDHDAPTSEAVLEVSGISNENLSDVSLTLRRGEVVGLFGLVGAGRTELARAIFGIDSYKTGRVTVGGQELAQGSPSKAVAAGLGLVPEERKVGGLVLGLPNIRNLELAAMRRWSIFTRRKKDDESLWKRYATDLGIVARGPNQESGTLSGGNQQKVVLAKWLATNPTVLILDEPTKGVDVGAKQDIYQEIRTLADEGMAILMISSESEEIRMLSDRVIVMREGVMTFNAENRDLDDELLLSYALGGQS